MFFSLTSKEKNTSWIPAFAGMTAAVILEIFYRGSRPIYYKYNEKRNPYEPKNKYAPSVGLVGLEPLDSKIDSFRSFMMSEWLIAF